jgi:hypothetical protein
MKKFWSRNKVVYALIVISWKINHPGWLRNNTINRKLRVATEIRSTFFWCLTSYRTKLLLIISLKFSIDRIPSRLLLKFWDFGRIMVVGQVSKSIFSGFYHHRQISDSKSIIVPYIENLGLWPEKATGADDHEFK